LNGIHEDGQRVNVTRWFRPDWGFHVKMVREVRPVRGAPELEIHEMIEPQRRD
jgi:hypothetical protein